MLKKKRHKVTVAIRGSRRANQNKCRLLSEVRESFIGSICCHIVTRKKIIFSGENAARRMLT